MNSIFGVSASAIMLVLVILFVVLMSLGSLIFLRNRVVFKLGIRNVPRRPAQTILIVVGLMLSTLIIAAAFTTGDTLNMSIKGQVYDILGQVDERVLLGASANDNSPQTGAKLPDQLTADLEARIQGESNVEALLPRLAESVPTINPRTSLSEPGLYLTGLDRARVEPFGGIRDTSGKAIDLGTLSPDGIVLSRTAADKLDAVVGDELTIYARNQPRQMRVEAIGEDSLLTGYIATGSSGGFAMPLARAQEILGYTGKISSIEVTNVGGVQDGLKRSGAAVTALQRALEGTPYQVVAIKQNEVDSAEATGNVFLTIFLIFGLFSISVGVLLIFLIFVMLAAERKPELGIARAVGMKRRQLMEMFLAEGLAYDLASALVGAALGVAVAFAIAGFMGRLIGEFIPIHPTATLRSLVIAYTLGVVVTYLTIIASSWRASRLNIVSAIRDIPEPTQPRGSRRATLLGASGVVFGALMLWAGTAANSAFLFDLGISLLPFAVAVILRRFGLSPRLLYSVAATLVMVYWLLPSDSLRGIFPELNGGIEMFFISGIMLVSAATVVVIWNAGAVTALVGVLGRRFSRWLPAVKTAIAYPLSNRGRTGMTIAMFSLVIFSLVMMEAINVNANAVVFGSENVTAGWDVQAAQGTSNPIPDLTAALKQNGFDTGQITSTGRVLGVSPAQAQLRMAGDGDWLSYWVEGGDDAFINQSRLPLTTRADGYADDRAVWNAVRDNPNLAVVDPNTVPSSGTFRLGGPSFYLTNLSRSDKRMDPTPIEIRDPATGKVTTVTVIGVIDSSVAVFAGVWVSDKTFNAIYAAPSFIQYQIRLQPGVDSKAAAKQIESALMTYGVQATSYKEIIEEGTRVSRGILQLIEGFMMLGLVVGIAALGVIAFRSVVERRQQIGMLRAIGYQRSMVAASFLIESSMITLLGVLSGALLGLILARNLITSDYFIGTGGQASFVVPWLAILLFVIVALIASLLMAYIPARRAASLTIAEALRYQ
jgi:putative ABC transport system permease protein